MIRFQYLECGCAGCSVYCGVCGAHVGGVTEARQQRKILQLRKQGSASLLKKRRRSEAVEPRPTQNQNDDKK